MIKSVQAGQKQEAVAHRDRFLAQWLSHLGHPHPLLKCLGLSSSFSYHYSFLQIYHLDTAGDNLPSFSSCGHLENEPVDGNLCFSFSTSNLYPAHPLPPSLTLSFTSLHSPTPPPTASLTVFQIKITLFRNTGGPNPMEISESLPVEPEFTQTQATWDFINMHSSLAHLSVTPWGLKH